jgi:hypothetical protein
MDDSRSFTYMKLEPGSHQQLRDLISEVVILSKEAQELDDRRSTITDRLNEIDKEVISLSKGNRFVIDMGEESFFVEFEEGQICLTDISTLTIDDYT